ncbi:MAG: hypothetical protein KJO33_07215, partial [Gammaproteobacteria bacterium]|nr:hypothetical protein [Gammaproteobacteria bacterium]
MRNIIFLFGLLLAPVLTQAAWQDQVQALHSELQALTENAEELSDTERLQRYYTLSYELTILEYPGFATFLGDPREQDRLTDLSTG